MDATQFRKMFDTLHNLAQWDLEDAGVITPGAKGGSDWHRFNHDLTTFVLKLPADRLAGLVDLVSKENA